VRFSSMRQHCQCYQYPVYALHCSYPPMTDRPKINQLSTPTQPLSSWLFLPSYSTIKTLKLIEPTLSQKWKENRTQSEAWMPTTNYYLLYWSTVWLLTDRKLHLYVGSLTPVSIEIEFLTKNTIIYYSPVIVSIVNTPQLLKPVTDNHGTDYQQ